LHLSSCTYCRSQQAILEPRLQPTRVFNLVDLRRIAAERENKIKPVLDDLRAWLMGLLNPVTTSFLPMRITASIAGGSQHLSGAAVFTLENHVSLDQEGRLRIKLSTAAAMAGFALKIALQDSERRLELCALTIKEGDLEAIVDCAFLQLPAGAVPPSLLQVTLVPAGEAQSLARPKLLPIFRRLLEMQSDLVEFWDQIQIILVSCGEGWKDLLRAEVTESESHADGLAVLQSVLQRVSRYVEVWRESNQSEPPNAQELLRGLSEIIQITQPRRKRSDERKPDVTVFRRRDHTKTKKPSVPPGSEEEDPQPR
jgi:hypothetical protein